jgi:hypothetical protein
MMHNNLNRHPEVRGFFTAPRRMAARSLSHPSRLALGGGASAPHEGELLQPKRNCVSAGMTVMGGEADRC